MTRVRETLPDGSFRPWAPFYRLAEGGAPAGQGAALGAAQGGGDLGGFYLPVRRQTAAPLTGTDVLLAPCDPDFDAAQPADAVLSVDALCTNRDLPADLHSAVVIPR